jgi:hypothetical protein
MQALAQITDSTATYHELARLLGIPFQGSNVAAMVVRRHRLLIGLPATKLSRLTGTDAGAISI